MSIIKVKNIELCYDKNTVIKDLSFDVEKGDYLCIIGQNGTGKSTLVKALASLIKVSSGTIEFDSEIKSGDIGYLSQISLIQKDFIASVFEIVLSGIDKKIYHPFYNKNDKQKAHSVLEKLGILNIKNKSFNELSGGQMQKVLLARATIESKKILILDEPTSALDPLASSDFYESLKKINDEKTTIIMVSHDISNSVKYSKHILKLGFNEHSFYKAKDYKGGESL